MVQRFSSREEAQADAVDQQRYEEPVHYARGPRYPDFPSILRSMMKYVGIWYYRANDVVEPTAVVMHRPANFSKCYTVLSHHGLNWYCDFPDPPYLLYQRDEWTNAKTVYVCEGERTSDAVEALGLPATTSLGGPGLPKKSDWTPLKGKNVVILSDYDDKGWNYAREVAQLCLGIGALSARIVMFPDLKVGEGPCEWMDNVRASSGDEAILPELQKLVDAAALVEPVPQEPKPLKGPQLELKSLAEFQPATQKWLFDKVVPQGKLTVLMGESGVGKSLTALEIAAKVTRGLTGPHDDQPQEPGSVILFAPDDGVAENILPRLEASLADLSKVFVIPGLSEQDEQTGKKLSWSFQLDRDMRFLETKIKSLQAADGNIRMLVIDPIDCFLESATTKKKQIAESLAARLSKLATETGLAIVVTTNLPRGVKGTSKLVQSMRRGVDMGPFGAAARSVWMVGQDLDNRNRRLLLPVKTNYCELPNSLAFQIVNGVIQWEHEPPTLTGDEYLSNVETELREKKPGYVNPTSKLGHAVKWLKGQLSDGPRHGATLIKDGIENNITKKTLRNAYDVLDCASVNDTFQGKWYWYLKSDLKKKPEVVETEVLQPENPTEEEVKGELNS